MTVPALALFGVGLIPADQPIFRADDMAVQRGDGVFESVRVANGRVVKLEAHLERLARSASLLDLHAPTEAEWRSLAALAVEASGAGDGVLKLVCTRGLSQDAPVTAFATVLPISESVLRTREHGVTAITLTLGIRSDVRADAPWLLGGAKTLSYAVNMASIRTAESRGADEVIWISADGYVLEAPTATVCWIADNELRTPPHDTGILAGTTLAVIEDLAAPLTFQTVQATAEELKRADEVFLASSIRGIAGVRAIDGVPIGKGTLGPQTIRLRDAFEEWVSRPG